MSSVMGLSAKSVVVEVVKPNQYSMMALAPGSRVVFVRELVLQHNGCADGGYDGSAP